MDQLILDVNADPYVLANSGGQGLTFKLLPDQQLNHLHQSKWPQICDRLQLLTASPLILIGHSNGGAAVIDIARCLQKRGKVVDLAITADSVLTLNDNGGTNKVPSNITINLNPYVIPTASWWELPFPFGQPNQRETGNPLDGILNIGLPFDEPGAIAHRDAFYDLAGGDRSVSGDYTYPEMMRDTVLSVLRGATSDQLFQLAQTDLQTLANEARVSIDLDTTNYSTKLVPAGPHSCRLHPPSPAAPRRGSAQADDGSGKAATLSVSRRLNGYRIHRSADYPNLPYRRFLIHLQFFEGVEDIHSLNNFSERRVFSIQMWRRPQHQEK